MVKLNFILVKKQGLNNKDIALIKRLHKRKSKLFKMAKYYLKKGDLKKAKETGNILKEIEFKMQDAWKFERNENMHTHWLFNPACSCPKYDNLDAIGTGKRFSNGECIVHDDIV